MIKSLGGADLFDFKVELDTGMGFNHMGTTQFTSVPYSLYAAKAKSVDSLYIGDLIDVSNASPAINQVIKWNGSAWVPEIDKVVDPDSDPNNEIQTLSLNGSNLTLSNNGGTVSFPNNVWTISGPDIYYNLGLVGVNTDTLRAPFHVGEGKTVLFGNDTLGKTSFSPDAKMMFIPGRGGAFRVGQLNADGSIIGGTGYDFWNPANIGWASIAIGNNTRANGSGSVALGIRSHAGNFGSVALGHLSRTLGNSAMSAGYYTRADAFVSIAVGAGNVGGGNPNTWIDTDPIFEVGNSTDTTN